MRTASNRQLTLLRKLNRKKYRVQEQLFIVEGGRAVRQVAENQSVRIKTLFFDKTRGYQREEEWKKRAKKVEGVILDEAHFAEVSDTDTPQGVLALCHMPEEASIESISRNEGIVVALDAVQDPGNVGTIIRTASWFGARALLSGKGTVDLFHPKVVRSTAGATGTIPHLNGGLATLLQALEEDSWEVLLLNKGARSVPLASLKSRRKKTVLVVGNEGHGIDNRLMTDNRHQVEISSPSPQPPVESLNAAIATSIALYHLSN
ncbi:TrmH family RNA methyltransferase [Fodinibius salsisoli]|uniref:RNA methyltransferase n=1 Tax=Fodinibius salsisoli TaxID=2820877 RepID=A0ABT3PRU1_9BACT|nr:RNA methyltransferase [Fodinibius salsisoli]MCW9708556.1 RNA methyltransferase [Fodinibius salsisoli]